MWKQDEKRILTAEMSWLQRIAGVTRLYKIRNDDIRQSSGSQTTLLDKVVQRRFWWFGHVKEMTIYWISHNALHAGFEGKRNKGRPRLRWIDNVNEDFESVGLTLRGAMDLTKNWGQWRSFIHTHQRQMAGVRNWWWWLMWHRTIFSFCLYDIMKIFSMFGYDNATKPVHRPKLS